jgi:hypothetical protein
MNIFNRHDNYLKDKFSQHELSEDMRVKFEKTRRVFIEYRDFLLSNGFIEMMSLREMYKEIDDAQYVVRRGNFEQVKNSIVSGENIDIRFDETVAKNGKYFNAALFRKGEESGLKAAFTEGFSQNEGVASVVGMKIGEGLNIERIENAPLIYVVDGTSDGILDRSQNRAIEGTVPEKDISFVILRVPLHAFPEDLMTEKEMEFFEEFIDKYENAGGKFNAVQIKYVTRIFVRPRLGVESALEQAA